MFVKADPFPEFGSELNNPTLYKAFEASALGALIFSSR
jgi:hypothetical protein